MQVTKNWGKARFQPSYDEQLAGNFMNEMDQRLAMLMQQNVTGKVDMNAMMESSRRRWTNPNYLNKEYAHVGVFKLPDFPPEMEVPPYEEECEVEPLPEFPPYIPEPEYDLPSIEDNCEVESIPDWPTEESYPDDNTNSAGSDCPEGDLFLENEDDVFGSQ